MEEAEDEGRKGRRQRCDLPRKIAIKKRREQNKKSPRNERQCSQDVQAKTRARMMQGGAKDGREGRCDIWSRQKEDGCCDEEIFQDATMDG